MDASWPVFPPELEREIFETTAEQYPETIYKPRLLLVAKRVHEWIERIKYRAVTSDEPTHACRLRLLLNALRSKSKPANFFHDRVRRLLIDYRFPEDELPPILSACTGIRWLALLNCPGPAMLPSLEVIQPRRLSISLWTLFGDLEGSDCNLAHPAFAFVTHLQSFDISSFVKYFSWSDFALLPALTHLALWKLSEANLTVVLSSCARLEVLVDMRWAKDRADLPSVDDARFVCVSPYHDNDVDCQWVIGTARRGGVDFWVRAERFVAKKRRGEIKPSSRCWIEDEDGIWTAFLMTYATGPVAATHSWQDFSLHVKLSPN
ncbi:hypothetical protein FB451DRAFT_1125383 [Mycena latifolia]|nr:hypothetical protein FB451DRAFT_1125383 [Mycena latifolia]